MGVVGGHHRHRRAGEPGGNKADEAAIDQVCLNELDPAAAEQAGEPNHGRGVLGAAFGAQRECGHAELAHVLLKVTGWPDRSHDQPAAVQSCPVDQGTKVRVRPGVADQMEDRLWVHEASKHAGTTARDNSCVTRTPSVSAVIPVHNGEEYLADAVSSALNQTYPVRECLVVDDGSTDSTHAVAQAFGAPVRYVHQNQGGVSSARNHGARIADGEYVAFLDHDDVWRPEKLARQIEALSAVKAGMALCAMQLVDSELAPTGTLRLRSPGDLLTGMLTFDRTQLVSCSSTGLVDRAQLFAIGGFDQTLSMSADWDLLARMLLGPGIVYVDEPLTLYRVHGSNMSRHIPLMEHDMTRAFEKTFADPRLPAELKEKERLAYTRLYRMLAGSYLDAGARLKAAQMVLKGLGRHPSGVVDLMHPRRKSTSGPAA